MSRTGHTIQLNASIPKYLMESLKQLAEREKRSISNLVSLLLEKEIKRIEIKKGDKN